MKNIKQMLSEEIKTYMVYLFSNIVSWPELEEIGLKKKIIVALAGDYGNFGDIAITVAQKQWLEKKFPDYKVLIFPIGKTYKYMKTLTKYITDEDIITLIGGGNTGDLYWSIELCRQFVIKQFPKNKIISFPQTIFHTDTKKMAKCIKVYSKHKDLTFALREKDSLDYANKYFLNNKTVFVPDTVLLLKTPKFNQKREGISLILRDDKEKLMPIEYNIKIYDFLKDKYKLNIFDTVFETKRLSYYESEKLLFDFLKKICASKVVVTDRLHAMIFCAITKTPCVILPINNVKLKGVYEWIKELNYIIYQDNDDLNILHENINKVSKIQPVSFDFDLKFLPLYEAFL